MKNKQTISFGILAIVAVLGISLVVAYPFGGNSFGFHEFSEEHRELMNSIIENEDFEAWKSFMQDRITEENFNALIERHSEMGDNMEARHELMEIKREAMESGDFEKMKELHKESGFKGWKGMGSPRH